MANKHNVMKENLEYCQMAFNLILPKVINVAELIGPTTI